MPDAHCTPEQEAFERGRRQAHLDAELESHEKRLNAINGSIEKHARNADALRGSIGELKDKFDDLAARLETWRAVEASRAEQLKRANEQQISTRSFWLGVTAIIAALVASVLSAQGGVFW